VAEVRRALPRLAPGRRRDLALPRRQGAEDRIEALEHRWFACEHQAVAALAAPDAAAGAHVDEMDAVLGEVAGAGNVVVVVRVAAVDDGIACREERHPLGAAL